MQELRVRRLERKIEERGRRGYMELGYMCLDSLQFPNGRMSRLLSIIDIASSSRVGWQPRDGRNLSLDLTGKDDSFSPLNFRGLR